MLKGYITVSEIAKQWKVNPRTIQVMCLKGKIQGTEKIGNMWMIPTGTERPVDKRVKSGKYIKGKGTWMKQTLKVDNFIQYAYNTGKYIDE